MIDLFFVDTNILIYSRDNDAGEKRTRAQKWLDFLWSSKRGRVSVQVLSELVVACKKRFGLDLSHPDLRDDVESLMLWQPLAINTAIFSKAIDVYTKNKLSWWDCLIVAAAVEAGCGYLLSEDMQDGFKYQNLTVVNPFKIGPEKLMRSA